MDSENIPEQLFTIITNNNGRYTFKDILQYFGGEDQRLVVVKAVARLYSKDKIVRIRGFHPVTGRVTFFYYDKSKVKPRVEMYGQ